VFPVWPRICTRKVVPDLATTAFPPLIPPPSVVAAKNPVAGSNDAEAATVAFPSLLALVGAVVPAAADALPADVAAAPEMSGVANSLPLDSAAPGPSAASAVVRDGSPAATEVSPQVKAPRRLRAVNNIVGIVPPASQPAQDVPAPDPVASAPGSVQQPAARSKDALAQDQVLSVPSESRPAGQAVRTQVPIQRVSAPASRFASLGAPDDTPAPDSQPSVVFMEAPLSEPAAETLTSNTPSQPGHSEISVPSLPEATSRTPKPLPDSAPRAWKMPDPPDGVLVKVLPAGMPETRPASPAKAQMGTVERVLASASTIWRPQDYVRQETADASPLRRSQGALIEPMVTDESPANAMADQSAQLPPERATAPPSALPGKPTENAHSELAFAMRLKPSTATEQPGPSVGDIPAASGESTPSAPVRHDPEPPVSETVVPVPRARKPEDTATPHADVKPSAQFKAVPGAPSEAGGLREGTSEVVPRESADPPRHIEPTVPEPTAPKSETPARDITLEVTGGERRVEVRVSERAGEVRVAVRTADSHLAGALRENLPGLSTRLMENGFRAEPWHPVAAAGESRQPVVNSSGSLAQDADPQSGQQGGGRHPGEGDSRQPRVPEDQIERKQKGREFEWFMASLQ